MARELQEEGWFGDLFLLDQIPSWVSICKGLMRALLSPADEINRDVSVYETSLTRYQEGNDRIAQVKNSICLRASTSATSTPSGCQCGATGGRTSTCRVL
jgi:hypothetical protein